MEKNIKNRLTNFFQKEQDSKEINSFWKFFLCAEESQTKEEALFDVWNQIEDSHPEMRHEAQKAYNRFQHTINEDKRSIRTSYLKPLLKYVAVFLSPILLFIMVWEYAVKDNQVKIISLSTSNATTKSATLPDGTLVMLNACTTIKYPAEFAENTREVTLQGEANFTVAHNKKKPFIVKTAQLSVTALGTKFNVRAYNAHKITTTLEHGSICIATETKAILVKPNEQVTFTSVDQHFETKRVNINNATAWTQGYLVFEDASLPEILAELERHHNISIRMEGKIDEKTLYSIKYNKNETLNQMLNVLCYMAGGTSYRIDDEKHIVIVTKLQ